MRVINFILALIVVVAVVHVEPNLGGRVLNMKEEVSLVSLDKGPVPPSGPSGCTYIPGSGGTHCHGKEINVAGNSQPHTGETYPLLKPINIEALLHTWEASFLISFNKLEHTLVKGEGSN
ncbi:hypothetical protein CR513_29780, partial [Mucuna pruriens]